MSRRNANGSSRRLGGILALGIAAAGCGGQEREQPLPRQYDGFHDVANCERIEGWAWDANHPDERIKVDLYDGDDYLTTVTADQFRPDLVKDGIRDGKHEFNLPLPAILKDGRTHVISARFAGTVTNLNRTPHEVKCPPGVEPEKAARAGESEKATNRHAPSRP